METGLRCLSNAGLCLHVCVFPFKTRKSRTAPRVDRVPHAPAFLPGRAPSEGLRRNHFSPGLSLAGSQADARCGAPDRGRGRAVAFAASRIGGSSVGGMPRARLRPVAAGHGAAATGRGRAGGPARGRLRGHRGSSFRVSRGPSRRGLVVS